MNDELIRKSDVLDLLDDLGLNLIDYDIYSQLFDTVDNMPPVNAVELPCKVGDTVYVINNNAIKEYLVGGFNVGMRSKSDSSLMIVLECTYPNIHLLADMIGSLVFLTQEEAEKALEDLKNE